MIFMDKDTLLHAGEEIDFATTSSLFYTYTQSPTTSDYLASTINDRTKKAQTHHKNGRMSFLYLIKNFSTFIHLHKIFDTLYNLISARMLLLSIIYMFIAVFNYIFVFIFSFIPISPSLTLSDFCKSNLFCNRIIIFRYISYHF